MRKQDDYEYGPRSGFWGNMNAWHFGAMILLGIFALGLYALAQFYGLRTAAAMEQADIARQLANGQGFTTHVIRPFDLWLLDIPSEDLPQSVPVLWQAPLYPYLLANVFRFVQLGPFSAGRGVMMAEARGVIPLGISIFILMGMAIWCLARACMEERVAHVVFVVLLVSPISLQLVLSGGALPLAMLLTVLSTLLAWHAINRSFRDARSWLVPVYAVMAGLCVGLLFLAHYAALLVGVGLLIWLGLNLQRVRWVSVALFGLALLSVVVPRFMLVRTAGWWGVAAYPYGALLDTSVFPGDALLRDGDLVLRNWQVTAAVREGIVARYQNLFAGQSLLGGGIIMVFFLAGLFGREERHWNQHAKWIVAAMLFLLPAFPPVLGCPYGHWPILFPLLVMFGVQAFFRIVDQAEYFDAGTQPVLLAFMVVLCVLPSAIGLVQRHGSSPYPPYHGPLQAFVSGQISEEQIMVSDIPAATAWYGQQSSLLWPRDVEHIALYESALGGVYLAGRGHALLREDTAWIRMRTDGVVPENFPFGVGLFLPSGEKEQILLLRETVPEHE